MLKIPIYADPALLPFIVGHWFELDYYKAITWSFHFPVGIHTGHLKGIIKTTNEYLTGYLTSAEWSIAW